ncbi:hypothetical protein [Actinopolymorpha alba]|uniref:hypothetical protein n=1 Tax=Actinopolymorpha alba TaxID=533267 RepID=UPI00192A96B0|nr:hypothetical protein [Actinopolymorpha alba]
MHEAECVVEACIVNHNTSEFAELALRTLIATHHERVAAGDFASPSSTTTPPMKG